MFIAIARILWGFHLSVPEGYVLDTSQETGFLGTFFTTSFLSIPCFAGRLARYRLPTFLVVGIIHGYSCVITTGGGIRRPKPFPLIATPRSSRRMDTMELALGDAQRQFFSMYGSE